jgi:hypothetical protein
VGYDAMAAQLRSVADEALGKPFIAMYREQLQQAVESARRGQPLAPNFPAASYRDRLLALLKTADDDPSLRGRVGELEEYLYGLLRDPENAPD